MTELFNAREGLDGRLPGVYLDEEERREAERLRAYREGREPNYEEFRPYVGDVLVPENQLEGYGRAVTSPVLSVPADQTQEGGHDGANDGAPAQEEERRINTPEDGVGVVVGTSEGATEDGVDAAEEPDEDPDNDPELFDYSDDDNGDNE